MNRYPKVSEDLKPNKVSGNSGITMTLTLKLRISISSRPFAATQSPGIQPVLSLESKGTPFNY